MTARVPSAEPFTYQGALSWLAEHYNLEHHLGGTHPVTDAPSLHRMVALMELLGNPQHSVPAIHITGTNGKGSTTAVAVALFAANGLTAGSFTSPHVSAPNDRIALAGHPLDDDTFAEAVNQVALVEPLLVKELGERPSYFEALAAAAYCHFADAAHVNVLEVGMGGRHDATNVVEAQVAVLTNVAADHLEIIGPTLADAATEKAGIISPGSTVVLGELEPELRQVVLGVAETAEAGPVLVADEHFGVSSRQAAVGGQVVDLRTPLASYDGVFLGLHGEHQAANAAVALTAVEAFLGQPLAADVVEEAFESVTVAGRFEPLVANPAVVVDAAHNPDGAAAAAETFEEVFGAAAAAGGAALVVGVSSPHDPRELLAALNPQRWQLVVATQADWPRSVPAGEVAAVARQLTAGAAAGDPATAVPASPSANVQAVENVAAAVDAARAAVGADGVVLVTGSTYVAAEARTHLA